MYQHSVTGKRSPLNSYPNEVEMCNIEQSDAGSEARGNGHGEILVELDLTRRSARVVSRSVVALEEDRA